MTESEALNIAAMSVDELEVEIVCARTEAKAHERCGDKAACHFRAVTIVNALLDEWKTRHVAPAVDVSPIG